MKRQSVIALHGALPDAEPSAAVHFEIVTRLGAPIAIRETLSDARRYAREIIKTFPECEVYEVVTPKPIRRRVWRQLQLVKS